MRLLSAVLSVLILVAGLAGASIILLRTANPNLLTPPVVVSARPADYEYQTTEGSKVRDFDLSFKIELNQPEDSARILVNLQPTDEATSEQSYDNAYYVDLSTERIVIGSFESGVGRSLDEVPCDALDPAVGHHVLIKRRTPWLTVIVDSSIIAMVQDDTHTFGNVALGLHGSTSCIEAVKVQPVTSIYFTDNFMRDKAESSPWTILRGDWSVSARRNPAMSADAFNYHASAPEVASVVAGDVFWDNYRFTSSAKSVDGESIGLMLYYRSERDYYLFTWDRRDDVEPTKATKRLVKMRDGVRTVLAENLGGFIPNQWYALAMEADGRMLRVSIDGHLVFSVQDDHLIGGLVGLYARATSQTRFDDVQVHTVNAYVDDMKDFPAGRWTELGGRWQTEETGGPTGSLVVQSSGGSARCVTGSSLWQHYAVSTKIEPHEALRCGLNLFYLDENTHYAAVCERNESGDIWKLICRADGVERLLGQAVTGRHESRYQVTASANRGRLAVTVDGTTLIEAFDRTLSAGAVGLWAEPPAEDEAGTFVASSDSVRSEQVLSRFIGLSVDFLREKKPLLTKNILFAHERTMGQWSGLVTDWTESTGKGGRTLNWHRGYFPGASTLEVKMSGFTHSDSSTTIILNADGTNLFGGYRLELAGDRDAADPNKRLLRLYRLAKEVASVRAGVIQPSSLKLERTGNLLVGYVDGRPVLAWHDEGALTGDRLGWSVGKVKVNPDDVVVSSPNVYQYHFTRAPVEWRSFGGIWEISSRWQCDPRWSFFSGRSVKDEEAVLWSKRLFKGDVTVEFYVGPKMDSQRGKRYEYVRDFNCTIGADGYDLSSGYSFLIGGFDNAKTCIYRKTKMIGKPSTTAVIPRKQGLHRRWLHVRIQKKGNRLRLWFERKLVVDVKDPEPLEGNRIAFWTKDCGFMLGKIVISCEDASQMEDPDIYLPGRCNSIYGPLVSAMLSAQSVTPFANR